MEASSIMKAEAILEYFLSQATWQDRRTTVDRIIMGDPHKEVKRILVTWMSTLPAVQYAIEHGFDMLMTHEPTFWIHANEIETLNNQGDRDGKMTASNIKRKLIADSGLVVVRNHDVWDRFPAVGIPWALARFLDIHGESIATGNKGYQLAFQIDAIDPKRLAEKVASRTAKFGEPVVQLFDKTDSPITRLGIGTGCACQPGIFLEMGCDGAIVCDDGCSFWKDISWAVEANLPLIRIGHGASEEPGMATLTDYINANLTGVSAEHFPLSTAVTFIG